MPVRLSVRRQEYADLRAIADAWGVPLGTVAWALVVDRLAELRKLAFDSGQTGIAGAAARYLVAATQRAPGESALGQVRGESDGHPG